MRFSIQSIQSFKEDYTSLAFIAEKLVDEGQMTVLLVSKAANNEDLHNMLRHEEQLWPYISLDCGITRL